MRRHLRYSVILSLWVCALSGLGASLEAEQVFLQERRVPGPEHSEVLTYIVTTGKNTYSFVPPPGWRLSVVPGRTRVLFRSGENSASITLDLLPPSNLEKVSLDSDPLADELSRRFDSANILEKFTTYTSGFTGRGFQIKWLAPGNVEMISRVAVFSTPRNHIEFAATSAAQLAKVVTPAFGRLLTSFQDAAP